MNIVVTTPISESENSRKEAEDCIESGGGYYFRYFSKKPKKLEVGNRIFYVDGGYIRGFSTVESIRCGNMLCETTNKLWPDGFYAFMKAEDWKWINPISHKGFQGFRYFDGNFEIVGDWLDSMPKTKGD